MGFRDHYDFNIALLAKPGCSLMTQPSCLMARVMKVRYFAKGNFLASKLRGMPGMIWRNIWKVKRTLLKGYWLWIGNGEEVNVWNNMWL